MAVKRNKPSDLYRASVLVNKDDMRKLKIVAVHQDKSRDEVLRELIAARVKGVRLKEAA